VPVSLIVPGSQIPFVKGGDKDKATLDIIGSVIDEVKRPIGQRARDGEAESRSEPAGAAERIFNTRRASICRRASTR
jgi:hypothetical protein